MIKAPHDRWRAGVFYRTGAGPLDVEHLLEELHELHDLVEAGPHWDTIERIVLDRLNHCEAADQTVEKAAGNETVATNDKPPFWLAVQ
jgi:hypothetical protein